MDKLPPSNDPFENSKIAGLTRKQWLRILAAGAVLYFLYYYGYLPFGRRPLIAGLIIFAWFVFKFSSRTNKNK